MIDLKHRPANNFRGAAKVSAPAPAQMPSVAPPPPDGWTWDGCGRPGHELARDGVCCACDNAARGLPLPPLPRRAAA